MLKISGIIKESIVDGPGIRYTVFVQGCPHHCEGCHNPQTHPFEGGTEKSVEEIFEDIRKNPLLSGVTFSGGEPFCQAEELAKLAEMVKKEGMNIVAYSGYTFEQLRKMKENDEGINSLLKLTDILIDGKFEIDKKSLMLKFRGSSNQRILDVKKSLENGIAVEKEI